MPWVFHLGDDGGDETDHDSEQEVDVDDERGADDGADHRLTEGEVGTGHRETDDREHEVDADDGGDEGAEATVDAVSRLRVAHRG